MACGTDVFGLRDLECAYQCGICQQYANMTHDSSFTPLYLVYTIFTPHTYCRGLAEMAVIPDYLSHCLKSEAMDWSEG